MENVSTSKEASKANQNTLESEKLIDKGRIQTSATPVDSKQSHSTDGSKTGIDEVN